ncbi:MAG: hypothetical protein P8J45_09895 [Phycisphaerales bacterium]|jgi:hypothetical protein|nr:hypothetical protein [Phycisphaerales bacterium]
MDFELRTIAYGVSTVVGVLGLYLFLRGVRGRNRGVRSCPSCHHLLADSNELRCPECGRLARSERQTLRTNRNRLSALFGMLLVVGSTFVLQQLSLGRANLLRGLPDSVLVIMLPYAGDSNSSTTSLGGGIHSELLKRLRDSSFELDAGRSLLDRVIKGDSNHQPGTTAWRAKYGAFAYALPRSFETDDPLLERFDEITPVVELQTPRIWPAGLPLVAQLTMNRFDLGDDPVEVAIDFPDGRTARFKHQKENRSRFPLAITLGDIAGTSETSEIPVRIITRYADGASKEHVAGIEINTDQQLIETLEARDSVEMQTVLLEQVFSHPISMAFEGSPPWSMRFQPRATRQEEAFEDVLVGLEVDLLHEGTLARRSWIWWSDGASGWETIFENEALLERAVELEGSWQLSLTGRPEIAARALIGRENPRTSYWGGSCSKPIRIMSRRGGMLPREWESMTGDASKPTPPPTPQK